MARKELSWLTARPIAHRGFHDAKAGRPENTLAAFRAAIAGNYAIECDLQLSSDGVPVVFHDDELKRLTGENARTDNSTAAVLGRLRVLGSAETIPTLDQMLAEVRGSVPLVIELKRTPGREPGFAREVVARLRKYSGGRAALMSFDRTLLEAARAAAPDFPIGLTAEGNWRRFTEHWRTILDLKLDFISYGIEDLPTPLPVIANRMMRIPLICWTVRTKSQRDKAKIWTDQITFEGFQP
jgi:glycerophosphoryl diester phosphodiesterase